LFLRKPTTFRLKKRIFNMKVTSDRIKARAEELRMSGFKLRGRMVRATLEMNAGARPLESAKHATKARTASEEQPVKPEAAEAA
jgi:hypothetical protein